MTKLLPLADTVICTDGDFGESVTESGIIIQKTIGKTEGVTARWFKVYAVGPDVKFVEPEDWVLVEYGRWTEGFAGGRIVGDLDDHERMWKVDYKSILAKTEDKVKPRTANVAGDDIVMAAKKSLY